MSASNDHMEGPRRVTSPPSFEIKHPRLVKVNQLPLLNHILMKLPFVAMSSKQILGSKERKIMSVVMGLACLTVIVN